LSVAFATPARSAERPALKLLDVFELEGASDPRISPDGTRVAYVRISMDLMKDVPHSSLWIVNADGSDHRPLAAGAEDNASPRWSPDGRRLAWISTGPDGRGQLWVRWMDTGQSARITQLTRTPADLSWSPDGRQLAFTMFVPEKLPPAVDLPELPEPPPGATWAAPAKVYSRTIFRRDGQGYVEDGHQQLFVVPADGGTPRQLTSGPFHVGSVPVETANAGSWGPPVWTPDGRSLLFASNRRSDWELDAADSEIYEVAVADGTLRALTDRRGPDNEPVVSPDGRTVAYLGFDDTRQAYSVTHLYLVNRDGTGRRCLTCAFDRDIETPTWSPDGRGLFIQFAEAGNTALGFVTLDGKVEVVARSLGGSSFSRPYGPLGERCYSVARDGRVAYDESRPDHPNDVVVTRRGGQPVHLTHLNDDLFSQRRLGALEEVRFTSAFDGLPLQGWLMKPPGFDKTRKYPFILEIHGGPVMDYGDRFTTEIQLYAAAGFVVLYMNYRGSVGYGQRFGNLIHRNYPGHAYDDLMSGVDAVIARGFVDPERLFVTGGSAGGEMTAFIVGKTQRFRAAVAAKPAVNYISSDLTWDLANAQALYFFGADPWEAPMAYWEHSPLSLVGNVRTPTMLITGEQDFRTPSAEAEQFYSALKRRGVDAALVRVPGASHDLSARPSQLISKVAHILGWFARYDKREQR
jgi:acylaminoacyl-peptidase